MASVEEQLQQIHPNCKIVETTNKHGEWAEFFRFFEMRVIGSPNGYTFGTRIPRPGFEHLANDHRDLSEIKASL